MTEFVWKSYNYVIAIDVGSDGVRICVEAKVHPSGVFEIVDMYELPGNESVNPPAGSV